MFTIFAHLPPELRLKIWQHALPKLDEPGLAVYKKGCWQPRFLTPSDSDYDEGQLDNIRFEFRYELLRVSIEMPLVFVSREARAVALLWVQKNDIEMQCSGGRLSFRRPMNYTIDALYLPLDRMDDFGAEPFDRGFEEDLIERHMTVESFVLHFAISDEFFRTDTLIPESWNWFDRIKTLYVVLDQEPDEHDPWEIVEAKAWTLIWTSDSGFGWREGEVGGDPLCKFTWATGEYPYQRILERILGDTNRLGESLSSNHSTIPFQMEIRLVSVVNR
ncbi:hypothetical protein FGRMN_915 [Fusarium graminum]|nr:hypothetical protein FGRMN_915 [Fusarium graminum]